MVNCCIKINVPSLVQAVLKIIQHSFRKKMKIKFSVCGRRPKLAKTAGATTLYELNGQLSYKKNVPFLV